MDNKIKSIVRGAILAVKKFTAPPPMVEFTKAERRAAGFQLGQKMWQANEACRSSRLDAVLTRWHNRLCK